MSVRPVVSALVLTLGLAVAALPAEAQRRGGGSRGGSNGGSNGGSRGGSYGAAQGGSHGGGAVYRPSGGGPRTGAQARHPRPGTGSGYYYGGRYGGYYGSYYRPYYGGYYAPYYGSGFYGSLSFGWPYSYSAWPYSSAGYSYSPGYDASYYAVPAREYDDRQSEAPPRERSSGSNPDSGRIRLEVRPEDTSVYVDDAFRGTARQAKGLILSPGRHTLELVRPGYLTERREVEVVTRASQDVLVEMQRR